MTLTTHPKRPLALAALLLIAALAACGGSTSITATPAASTTPTSAANRAQATQPIPIASPTVAGTPTPLANTGPIGTEAARATGGATAAANINATPTPLARTTVVNSPAAASTVVRATSPSGSATVSASGSAAVGTAGPPTTTPVPTTEARGTVEQFLRTVLGKGDITGYLTPAFKSQAGSDGYKLLNIQPPVQEFTVDSEQRDADGNGAVVRATITTAAGIAKRGFVLRKQGSAWLVDNILN